MSKFSLEILKRLVYPYFQSSDPDVVLGATFGEDVALTRVGNDLLASHVDPIVGAVHQIGWLAVHVACNDIATCGAPPRWLQVLVLVPQKKDEDLLEQIMKDIHRAAEEVNVSIIGGHTGYSASLSRPLVAVTALGNLGGQHPILTRGAQPGDHIIVTKGIPLEGTAILADDFAGTARSLGMSQAEINAASALYSQVSVIQEALLLAKLGATCMHDVTRGGLLETLREIAMLSEVGISVDFARVPIPVVAKRFIDAFKFDPLRMISSGTLVATLPEDRLQEASDALVQAAIPFADVGLVRVGKGARVELNGTVKEYENVEPDDDELARMWVEYTPDN